MPFFRSGLLWIFFIFSLSTSKLLLQMCTPKTVKTSQNFHTYLDKRIFFVQRVFKIREKISLTMSNCMESKCSPNRGRTDGRTKHMQLWCMYKKGKVFLAWHVLQEDSCSTGSVALGISITHMTYIQFKIKPPWFIVVTGFRAVRAQEQDGAQGPQPLLGRALQLHHRGY